jgi:hypothetical protein
LGEASNLSWRLWYQVDGSDIVHNLTTYDLEKQGIFKEAYKGRKDEYDAIYNSVWPKYLQYIKLPNHLVKVLVIDEWRLRSAVENYAIYMLEPKVNKTKELKENDLFKWQAELDKYLTWFTEKQKKVHGETL